MVTVKLKQIDADRIFLPTTKGAQNGAVILTMEELQKICEFEKAYDEFMRWTKRNYHIFCHGRTPEANKAVGGNANSNHMELLAKDTYFEGIDWDKTRFIKYANKWKEISAKHNFVGEIGWYTSHKWDKYNCKGMIHIGGYITYSKTFYHWVTDSRGVQMNLLYKDEIK